MNLDSSALGAHPFAVELKGVRRTLDGFVALDRLDWRIPVGAHAVILGPNGSGKSTLLRLITGYLFPTDGAVSVLGETLGQVDVGQLRRKIGLVDPRGSYLSDHQPALDLVVSGFFGHWTADFDDPSDEMWRRAGRALSEVGLPSRGKQVFGTLSSGERLRVLLARALVHEPELLLLDEPTQGLDLLARETFLATLRTLLNRRPSLTLLLVTHHLEEIPPSTSEVLLLKEGRKIASGPPSRTLRSEPLSQALGCPVEVEWSAGRWRWSVDPRVWDDLTGTIPR